MVLMDQFGKPICELEDGLALQVQERRVKLIWRLSRYGICSLQHSIYNHLALVLYALLCCALSSQLV